MSRALLLDEPVIALQPALVRALGGDVHGAIVLQQIAYWMPFARSTYAGHVWVYKTYEEMATETALSADKCRRTVKRLEERGVLVSCQPGGNERVKWYRIDYDHELFHAADSSDHLAPAPDDAAPVPLATGTSAGCSSSTENTQETTSLDTEASAIADEEARPEVEFLCNLLADLIAANGSKRPTITKAWRTSARLLLDRDGRTPTQVENCIRWCQADDFWCGVILSMPKLRKQYDALRLRAQQKPNRQQALLSGIEDYLVATGTDEMRSQ